MASTSKSQTSKGSSSSGNSGGGKKRNYPIFENNDKSGVNKRRKEGDPLKIWSWNVAGLRACVKKDGTKHIRESNADIVILQETKCAEFPDEINALDEYVYKRLVATKEGKGGYAGIAMLSKEKPLKVEVGIDSEEMDSHGRYIQAEFPTFIFVGVYVLNSGSGLVNLQKRGRWDNLLRDRITQLDKRKPVILAGDLNVAHQEIDLRNPETNRNKTAGFTDQERAAFSQLLEAGFVDVWRERNPGVAGAYTYWSYIGSRKTKNIGWRLDYFVVSRRVYGQVRDCEIHSDIREGNASDHCPISMVIDI